MLEGASNFRDLGGYRNRAGQTVRSGRIYRSDHLAKLTAADHARLRQWGVTHSLDFRGELEAQAAPYAIEGVERVPLAIEPTVVARLKALTAQGIVPSADDTVELMRETYRDFVNRQAPVFARFLRHVLHQESPQVFHCTAGKDRTGFAAALLLGALDVDRDTIAHDYLLTNQRYRRDPSVEGPGPAHVLQVLWQVQPAFLQAALDEVDRTHGGLAHYLRGPVGLDEAELRGLRQALLVSGA